MVDEANSDVPRESFVAQLIGDLLIAEDRLRADDGQANRRDVVRTGFAAIEGLCWDLREHVRSTAADLGDLDMLSDMALREQTYSVSNAGAVSIQPRFLPLPTAFRLAVRQAQISSPDLLVDFQHAGWDDLQRAIKVRNRVTHPKVVGDLVVTDTDLATLRSGLFWLLPTIEYVMSRMNQALALSNEIGWALLEQLKSGDPSALAEYHALLDVSDD